MRLESDASLAVRRRELYPPHRDQKTIYKHAEVGDKRLNHFLTALTRSAKCSCRENIVMGRAVVHSKVAFVPSKTL
jgi:hypothetical protein